MAEWTLSRSGLLVAQRQAACVERLDDFVDRLLAEVRDRVQFALCLRHEVADRLDPGPLQAVVRADAELQLLDQDVVERVRLAGGPPAPGTTPPNRRQRSRESG